MRISGVKVGRVVTVEERGGVLDATMELDKQFAPLPADAKGVIRIKTLLGETFVELTPGQQGRQDRPRGRLPAARRDRALTDARPGARLLRRGDAR